MIYYDTLHNLSVMVQQNKASYHLPYYKLSGTSARNGPIVQIGTSVWPHVETKQVYVH